MPAPKRKQGMSISKHDEAIDDYINSLEAMLRDCAVLAAALMGSIAGRDGKPYPPHHKEIINRAQRLLGGRELP